MRWTLTVPDWIPVSCNVLMHGGVGKRIRLKKSDRDLVAWYAHEQQIPEATGPRLVSVEVTKPKGNLPDAHNLTKSLFDALVQCRLLVDDDVVHLELSRFVVQRGPVRQTRIVLEELDDALREEEDSARRFRALLAAIDPLRGQLKRFENAAKEYQQCALWMESGQMQALALAVKDIEEGT